MKDYLIVGLGLSGASIAFRLENQGNTFQVFNDGSQEASKVAGGLINPVILKRFTLAWKADEQMPRALKFYRQMETTLGIKVLKPLEIFRRFSSIEEQNNWFTAADNPRVSPFLDMKLVKDINKNIIGEFSFGRVLETQRLDTRQLLNSYSSYLEKKKLLIRERFEYEHLRFSKEGIEYKGVAAKKIIFTEGFGLLKNPFFNYLPLKGNKGEYILIKAPGLNLKYGVKSSVFIFPAGEDDVYAVGATYSNTDKSTGPTAAAREELLKKVQNLVKVDFRVVGQVAGVRPSTIDRRPLVGQHPLHKNMYCCNGFGSRGILMAPTTSKELLCLTEKGHAVSPEIDLARFTKKWYPTT